MSDFNDFKGRAGVFATKAAGAAKSFASKTKQIGRVAKLNMDIASEKDAIRRAYEEMGRLYYENHQENPEGLLAPACQSVAASFAAIAAMEEEIEQLKEKGEEEPAADFQTVVDQTEAEAAAQEPEEEYEEPDIEVEIEVDLSDDESAEEDEGLEIEIEIPADEEPQEETSAEEDVPVDIEISIEPEEPAPEEAAPLEEPSAGEEIPAEEAPEEIPADDEPVEPAIEE
ncbi:MAG: hypothetical protein LJU34_01420 [Oscillospiraceae bacterium]|nr:hypothetical protein [Oscillospiraceae bacterium]